MALFQSLRTLGIRMLNTLNTPLIGTGGVIDNTPPELRPLLYISDEERWAQERVIVARAFHDGQHGVKLTARLRQFLGSEADQFALRFNLCKKINKCIARRLVVEGFGTTAGEDDGGPQTIFADTVWAGSRMKGKRARTLIESVRDGESFWMVDFDKENNRPRITPHVRYTDATVACNSGEGGGEGMWMVYPNGDVDQKPLCAIKRWVEHIAENNGEVRKEPRLNVYYPDRVVKYAQHGYTWRQIETEPWVDGKGNELGIPVVHIKTPELLPATFEAIPLQKGLNKTLVDLFASSDATAFRILIALGWNPTDKEGNPLPIDPGQWVGTEEENASVTVVDGADLSNQIAVVDKLVAIMADEVDIPLSMLNKSNQRAAEGTLQEEKEDFGAVVRDYRETVEMGIEDALKIARRLANEYGDPEASQAQYGYGELDEKPQFKVKWEPFTSRSVADKTAESNALAAVGIPQPEIWKRVWGYTPKEANALKLERDRGAGDPNSF